MLKRLVLAMLAVAAVSSAAYAKLPAIPKGNHYICYPATFTDPFIIRKATFADQFGIWNVKVLGISRLCVPARKKIDGKVFEIVDPADHLTCYKIELLSNNHLPPVNTNDQFGGHLNVRLTAPTEVCLPAGKLKLVG